MKTTMDRPTNFLRNVLALAFCSVMLGAAPVTTISGTTNADVLWIDVPNYVPGALDVEVRNRDRSFIPELTVVNAGSAVRFPNDDPFYHSIYSEGKINAFDIGYYGPGPGKAVSMQHSGVMSVRCHIHPRMHATIVVVDGPSATASNGRYTLANVSPGTYTLHAWSARAGEKTFNVTVPESGLVENVTL